MHKLCSEKQSRIYKSKLRQSMQRGLVCAEVTACLDSGCEPQPLHNLKQAEYRVLQSIWTLVDQSARAARCARTLIGQALRALPFLSGAPRNCALLSPFFTQKELRFAVAPLPSLLSRVPMSKLTAGHGRMLGLIGCLFSSALEARNQCVR